MTKVENTRERELRYTPAEVELRSGAGGSSRTVGGYASVFGSKSQPLPGGFVEIVEPRAFNKSEGDGWPGVVCRYEHQTLLGTTSAGTLRLSRDSTGLDYSVDLPRSRDDVLELVSRKDLTNSSFAFQVFDQDWTDDGGDYPVRHLTALKLIDVAPVTIGAYCDATVGLRSLAAQFGEDPNDIFELAKRNELRTLFRRSDTRGATISGRAALVQVMGMASNVPYVPPPTHAQRMAELTVMALPQPVKPLAERMVELTEAAQPPYESADSVGLRSLW